MEYQERSQHYVRFKIYVNIFSLNNQMRINRNGLEPPQHNIPTNAQETASLTSAAPASFLDKVKSLLPKKCHLKTFSLCLCTLLSHKKRNRDYIFAEGCN